MEPQIRYVKSADGTRIGYWAFGSGRPLVVLPTLWIFSIHSLWEVPGFRANMERLAQTQTVVLYDARGQGSSSRDVTDCSLDAYIADLAAVVTQIGAPQVDMMAASFTAMPALAYSAQRPESVRRLVLANPFLRGRDYHATPEMRAVSALIDINWELYLRTMALVWFGWTETGRIISEMTRRDASRETMVTGFAEMRRTDVASILSDVTCPTLVMHAQLPSAKTAEVMQNWSAMIPNARLVMHGDDNPLILAAQSLAPIAEEFLAERDEEQSASARSETTEVPSGTAVILFADIVDSTALTDRLGDTAFRDKARDLDTNLRAIIRENAGTPIEGKLLGDGVLAVFTSARQAIEAAVRCGKAGDDSGLPLHLGINAGDVLRETDPGGRANVYGGAVNIAARIAADSAPGEVLVSETVRSLARTSSGVRFEDRGERDLKGVGEPVRVWSVRAAD